MIHLKTLAEIETIRIAAKILAKVLRILLQESKAGTRLRNLDTMARELIEDAGARPAFLGYRPPGQSRPYPKSICTSVNDTIVHGLPDTYRLQEGDLLSIDLGVLYKGYYADSAKTIGIGHISKNARDLLDITQKALDKAVKAAKIGGTLGDIGFIIESAATRTGFYPARGLTGHGIGRDLHEDPTIYNEGKKGAGIPLEVGMVLAIEPMFAVGTPEVIERKDGSFATADGSISAHFEHTIAITKQGPDILTK